MSTTSIRWSSRISFIFAASAAAIGLGNIWRFPFMVGQGGGGAFVLVYLGFVIVLGMPLLIAEAALGRMGRSNPVAAITSIAKQSKQTKVWGWLGGLTILAGYFILTYYVVIVGWVLDYLWRAVSGEFAQATESTSLHAFQLLQDNSWEMLLTDTIVVFGAMGIIILGIKQGLERAVMLMFPALLVLMLALLAYAFTTSGFHHAVKFLFEPDFSELTSTTVLDALGQAFFSLNIAMGVTIMFSAYLPEKTPLTSSMIAVAIADTGVALLAGLIIFPIVFTNHLPPEAGPSLIFKTLPIAFGHMHFSTLIATLFFLMLFFAAFSSVIAVLEPAVAWIMEGWHISRTRAVAIAGITCWILSFGTIASFSYDEHFQLFGKTFFQIIDFLTASIMLPVGGFLIAVFTGWLLAKKLITTQLHWNTRKIWFQIWLWLLRVVAPIGILFILLKSVGML